MSNRTTIYIQPKMHEVLKVNRVQKISTFVNASTERYTFMIKECLPALTVTDYTEIFEHMAEVSFDRPIEEEVAVLPVLMGNKDVSVELVAKVEAMNTLERIALIDIIERSQRGK